ncbi:hypothetical protein [Mycobacterium sp.]|uniref:hypothetical protein n=1 Tax=Mycobacterium sp. TaxID=1785 RepID=UPI00257D2650|nr:hypothetical protein [Mycobacterium sp.]
MVSLGIALVAAGIAIGAWFRPLPKNDPPPAPTYSSQQVADAKSKVCAAYAKVHHAVGLTSGRSSEDPTVRLVIATSGRQALAVGATYLLAKVDAEPATSSELKTAIRNLANAFRELAIDYLAEVSDSELDPLLRTTDKETLSIESFCK